MAIRDVVTMGFGNGTFSGTIPFVTTLGYSISAVTPADFAVLHFTLPDRLMDFTLPDRKADFTLPNRLMDFDVPDRN